MAKAKHKKSKIKSEKNKQELIISFTSKNYKIIIAGLITVVLGLFLMSGGSNGPDEWDVNKIYSTTRITLAPAIIIIGLVMVIFAIFVDDSAKEEA